MPKGTPQTRDEANSVWQEDDCARWNEWLYSYDQAIAATANEKLANLDRWYREELPLQIIGRVPPCIYHDELEGITAWKMHRGVWRERNRLLVASNPPERVEEVSREAYAAVAEVVAAAAARDESGYSGLTSVRKPVALLSTLAGVGPATASAVLAAYAPHIYPFFDELVANYIPGFGPVSFTLPSYLRYADAIRERAHKLNITCSSRAWRAQDVAQALWALGAASTLKGG